MRAVEDGEVGGGGGVGSIVKNCLGKIIHCTEDVDAGVSRTVKKKIHEHYIEDSSGGMGRYFDIKNSDCED